MNKEEWDALKEASHKLKLAAQEAAGLISDLVAERDGLARRCQAASDEIKRLSGTVARLEKWLDKVSAAVGLQTADRKRLDSATAWIARRDIEANGRRSVSELINDYALEVLEGRLGDLKPGWLLALSDALELDGRVARLIDERDAARVEVARLRALLDGGEE